MRQSAEVHVMKPYLRKLMREHRRIDRLIDTSKNPRIAERLKRLKRLRLRLKDRIAALQRHYNGRTITG